jgi:tetratricopeptide (TPR) repeat protein
LELNGDWPGALENYRQAALDQAPPHTGGPQLFYDADGKLADARKRFEQRLVDLRASGKSAEAASLEARVKELESGAGLDEKFHSAIAASGLALSQQHFDEAETRVKEAVEIAEKIQPPDGRLPDAVGSLGAIYLKRLENDKANEQFKRQLVLCEKIYGAASPMLARPLGNLAAAARLQKNYPAAEEYYGRAIELVQRAYGANSTDTADLLRSFSMVYLAQKDYTKAESILMKSIHIDEQLYGGDSIRVAFTLNSLCIVYDEGAMPEKSVGCHARILSIVEKQFGADSQYLLQDLAAEAKALRLLGRNDEAAKLEKRKELIEAGKSAQALPANQN